MAHSLGYIHAAGVFFLFIAEINFYIVPLSLAALAHTVMH